MILAASHPRKSAHRLASCLLLGLLLAACSREGPPAPLVIGDSSSDLGGYGGAARAGYPGNAGPAGPEMRETAGGTVTVARGQTLYAVARAQNVPVRSLIDANHLAPPYHIQAGDRLVVPHIREHVVQPGETLYAVSRRYGVEATTLAQANHLEPPYNIRSGEELVLPPAVSAPSSAYTPTAVASAQAQPLAPPVPLAPAKPQVLTAPGTAAKVPPGKPPAAAAADNAAPGAPVPLTAPGTSTAAAPPPAPATPGQLTPPPGAKAVQAPAEPEEQPAGAEPAPSPSVSVTVASIVAGHRPPSSPYFYWPVRGQIISVFGPASGGMHNDGINIVAPEGTTVSAAENGVVAYAGNELKGFGNLLLIKHSGGWISAYAHNKVLLVKKGDHVRRGQPIAQIGETGGVNQPQLHFELRQGTKAIDPLDHLPALSGNG